MPAMTGIFCAVAALATAALSGMLLIALLNAYAFPRLSRYLVDDPAQHHLPPVSVLIPARQEEERIAPTVAALLAQDYPDFEVLVLDDNSTDATFATALAAGCGDSRLRVLHGKPLPSGWGGKNWACHQLAQTARYDLLIFTDADVTWGKDALMAVVRALERTNAGLLAVWPTQITVGWVERLVVPLMAFSILAYLPVWLVSHTPYPAAAAAAGQCMAFRRPIYRRIGGHAAIRATVLDDVTLARRVKQHGDRLAMVDGDGLVLCRMYLGGWQTVNGYTKNIMAGHGNNVFFLLLSTLFHLVLFVLPLVWLIAGLTLNIAPGWPLWPLALLFLAVTTRAITAYTSRQRISDALLMPLSVLLMTFIALRAIWRQYRYGGQSWKGRQVS
jgi:chlorobactene glucosyltransferase